MSRECGRGFTLVEVMVVVTMVGVLAMLGTHGVRRWTANSKTAEARNSLGAIGKLAGVAYQRNAQPNKIALPGVRVAVRPTMCASATKTVPASIAKVKGEVYQSAPSDWNTDEATNKGFSCLRFTMSDPQRYLYNYTMSASGYTVGDTFTATANGDLNGDGILSTFTLTGKVSFADELTIAPAVAETDPDE